ncbi:MaoC family dehydratase [Paenalcaligenes hominis]|uniref:MaoC family dehydratase n=1 Tax=Paenalcaligenes hominis TaxID=643674 RepID=UPI003524A78A
MSKAATKRYLEELTEGDRYKSGSHVLDAEQIISYAKQFDPQVFHTDPVLAQQSFFNGLAASGWHTAAITMKLLVESIPFAGGLVGAGCEVTWPQATRPSDQLHVESEIISITPSRTKKDRGIVLLESLTKNQHGDIVQRMLSKVVVRRKNIEL